MARIKDEGQERADKAEKTEKSAKKGGREETKEGAEEKARREEALRRALTLIEKQFGAGTIMKLSSEYRVDAPAISTGALSLDMALGVGGLPRGRVVEIFGPESSGKSTLAMTVVRNAQREGGVAAYIDAEHALDPIYARRLGVKVDELLLNQPDTGEQALEIADQLVRSGAVDVIVVDSVAALVPKAEIAGDIGDSHVGLQARLMSQALRKLTGSIARSNSIVIFINQLREKIGAMGYGPPETTPGGRALKFYASVRIDLRRIGLLKEGDRTIGSTVRAKVVKNKVAPPFRSAEFDILFQHGISWEGTVLDLGVQAGVVSKSGTWLSFGEARLGQGREAARRFLMENRDVCLKIAEQVRARREVLECGISGAKDE